MGQRVRWIALNFRKGSVCFHLIFLIFDQVIKLGLPIGLPVFVVNLDSMQLLFL